MFVSLLPWNGGLPQSPRSPVFFSRTEGYEQKEKPSLSTHKQEQTSKKEMSGGLQVIPANKALRARIISFLHRMVDCLGDKLLPFLPEAFRALLPTSAEPRDICDTLALLNQLIVRYKAALDPFLVNVAPLPSDRSQFYTGFVGSRGRTC
jgi:hypothetical protein